MTLRPFTLAGFALALSLLGTGCERMSWAQLREGLLESVMQGQAQAMTNDVVEISTSFTIGQGLAEIRDQIRAFAESQAPCTTVTLSGETGIIIDFGELGDCAYRGRTYSGVVTIDLALAGEEVIVSHEYEALRNEQIQLDGQVEVTWGGGARHVVSQLEFEGEDPDGEPRTLTVQADRTMTLVDPGLGFAGGVEIDGQREWEGERGPWHLEIDSVEIRGADPVPQAGSYTLITPEDYEVVMSFERVDEDTIAVTVKGERRERTFEVSSSGSVSE